MITKSVYIAGPMRHYDLWNFPAFDEAKKRWESAGWLVYSPAAVDRALGFDPTAVISNTPLPEMDEFVTRALRLDLILVESAEAIALLPGWRNSTGATAELAVAQYLGRKVYDATTMQEIGPKRCPWFSESQAALRR
jgi:hypothetical protein